MVDHETMWKFWHEGYYMNQILLWVYVYYFHRGVLRIEPRPYKLGLPPYDPFYWRAKVTWFSKNIEGAMCSVDDLFCLFFVILTLLFDQCGIICQLWNFGCSPVMTLSGYHFLARCKCKPINLSPLGPVLGIFLEILIVLSVIIWQKIFHR